MADKDLVALGPFTKGVNNRRVDHALGSAGQFGGVANDMLRSAVNVEIDDTGRVSRREGYSVVYDPAEPLHSGFECPAGVLFAEGRALKLLNPDTGVVTLLRADLALGQPVAYVEVNGETYYSNGVVTGKVVNGAARQWGVELPSGLPSLSAISGALPAGVYQVAVTFENASGEESGSGLAVTVDLAENQGIDIVDIPGPLGVEVAKVNVYCSAANGDVLFRIAQLQPGISSFKLLVASFEGARLATQFLAPLPPGRVLASANGRIYSGYDNVVFYTEPLAYGLCRPSTNFLLFPAPVRVMAGVSDGLYVVADQTYFLSGSDPAKFESRVVLPYSGAFGSAAQIPTEPDAWVWYGDRGLVTARAGGQVKAVQEEQLALDPAVKGASLHVEQDGKRQIISLSAPASYASSAAAQGFVDMEIRRKGT